jgi:hypothetical protein
MFCYCIYCFMFCNCIYDCMFCYCIYCFMFCNCIYDCTFCYCIYGFMFCMLLFNFVNYVFYCYVYIFLLLRMFCSLYSVLICFSVNCFCVNVYYIIATGCQTIAVNKYTISYHIIMKEFSFVELSTFWSQT